MHCCQSLSAPSMQALPSLSPSFCNVLVRQSLTVHSIPVSPSSLPSFQTNVIHQPLVAHSWQVLQKTLFPFGAHSTRMQYLLYSVYYLSPLKNFVICVWHTYTHHRKFTKQDTWKRRAGRMKAEKWNKKHAKEEEVKGKTRRKEVIRRKRNSKLNKRTDSYWASSTRGSSFPSPCPQPDGKSHLSFAFCSLINIKSRCASKAGTSMVTGAGTVCVRITIVFLEHLFMLNCTEQVQIQNTCT